MSPAKKPAKRKPSKKVPPKAPKRRPAERARQPPPAPPISLAPAPPISIVLAQAQTLVLPEPEAVVASCEIERLETACRIIVAEVLPEGRLTASAARAWREVLRFTLAVDEQPDVVGDTIAMGIDRGAWRHFKTPDGQPFDTFEAFCQCPEPYGLGRHVDEVMAALGRVLGKKAAQLATVTAARQGRRADPMDGTSGHDGPKSSTRNDKRLRAIDNGHPVIRDLFHRDMIGIAEAAKVAAKADDQATAVLIPQVEAVAAQPGLAQGGAPTHQQAGPADPRPGQAAAGRTGGLPKADG